MYSSRIRIGTLISLAFLIGLATHTNAKAADDLVGVRAAAMGGAVRAVATGTSGVLVNPAGMSLARQYVVGGVYQFRSLDNASQVNVSIVDSVTARIAAGLSYSFVHAKPKRSLAGEDGPITLEETHKTHEVALAMSIPIGSWLSVGTTTRYINHSLSRPKDAPKDLPTLDLSTVGLDIGAILRPAEMIRVAVVGHNLIPIDDELYPQSLGLGLALTPTASFVATFDSVVDFTSDPDSVTSSFHGGLEGFIQKRYAIRLGASHDLYRDATYVGGGLALVTRKLGIDLALRQQVNGGTSTTISAGLSLYVQ